MANRGLKAKTEVLSRILSGEAMEDGGEGGAAEGIVVDIADFFIGKDSHLSMCK